LAHDERSFSKLIHWIWSWKLKEILRENSRGERDKFKRDFGGGFQGENSRRISKGIEMCSPMCSTENPEGNFKEI
jgi:hypothetical protein